MGQYEGYSLGDSISDSSKKLLQRGRGEGHYICDFGGRGEHAIKHIFLQKVSAGHVDLLVITMKDFSTFLEVGKYKNWDHKMGS